MAFDDIVAGRNPVLLYCANVNAVHVALRHVNPRCRMSLLLHWPTSKSPINTLILVADLPAPQHGWLWTLTSDPRTPVILCIDHCDFYTILPVLPPARFVGQTLFLSTPLEDPSGAQTRYATWVQAARIRRLVLRDVVQRMVLCDGEVHVRLCADLVAPTCLREVFCCQRDLPLLLQQRRDWDVLGVADFSDPGNYLPQLKVCQHLQMLYIAHATLWPCTHTTLADVTRECPSVRAVQVVCTSGWTEVVHVETRGQFEHPLLACRVLTNHVCPAECGANNVHSVDTKLHQWMHLGRSYSTVKSVYLNHELVHWVAVDYPRLFEQLHRTFPNLVHLAIRVARISDDCLEAIGQLGNLKALEMNTRDSFDDVPPPLYRLTRLTSLRWQFRWLAHVSRDVFRFRHLVLVRLTIHRGSGLPRPRPATLNRFRLVVDRNRLRVASEPHLTLLVRWARRRAVPLPNELLGLIVKAINQGDYQ